MSFFSPVRGIFEILFLLSSYYPVVVSALSEPERVEQYDKRYPRSWPPKQYTPATDGWVKHHEERFRQLYEMDDYNDRYEGFLQTVFPAFLAPNFTEYGFGLAKAPAELTATLQQAIWQGLARRETKLESEDIGRIEGPRALFLERPDLTERVLDELLGPAEAWSGVQLAPHEAYGFRLYQNESVLGMHVDKKQTHVISIVYHIDRALDAKPWPIYIEDFHGRTFEVLLEPGEMLFYESAKCLHGRPTTFHGSYFASVFVHYTPLQGWQDEQEIDYGMESHYIIPPNWNERKGTKTETPLEMIGTAFKEPTCPNGWCATQNAIPFSGTQDGYWIDPSGNRHPLNVEQQATREEL